MNYSQNKKTVRELKKIFLQTFKSIDDLTIQRKRKVFSNHILYMFLLMSVNQCGYQDALFDLNTKKLIDNNVSHQAINKKVLSGKFKQHQISLNDQIIQKFFKKERSGRTFGVDGSQVNLSSSLNKNGFRPVKSLKYCQGLLTIIFDIDFQIPFAYQLTSSTNLMICS
jgi:hypothetical protein